MPIHCDKDTYLIATYKDSSGPVDNGTVLDINFSFAVDSMGEEVVSYAMDCDIEFTTKSALLYVGSYMFFGPTSGSICALDSGLVMYDKFMGNIALVATNRMDDNFECSVLDSKGCLVVTSANYG